VDRETANRASSIRGLWYITGAECDWTCTFNEVQNFPNPAGFDGMRPCEVSREHLYRCSSRHIQRRGSRRGDTILFKHRGRTSNEALLEDSVAGEPSMALLCR